MKYVKNVKNDLVAAAKERNRALDELKEIRRIAREVNMKLMNISGRTNSEVNSELISTKQSDSTQELDAKQKDIECLKTDLHKNDARARKTKVGLNDKKGTEAHAMKSLTQTRCRVLELNLELEAAKQTKEKARELFKKHAQQLKKTNKLLKESGFEIDFLQQKLEKLERSSKNCEKDCNAPCPESNIELRREIERLQSELLHLLTKVIKSSD